VAAEAVGRVVQVAHMGFGDLFRNQNWGHTTYLLVLL
jgi:hypothetical protein